MTDSQVSASARPAAPAPLLEARGVAKVFSSGTFAKRRHVALEALSFSVPERPPTITAVAGESGSGKTTLARLVLGLIEPSEGEIRYRGKLIREMDGDERRQFRREVQTIFQDPFESYNPFYKVDHVLTTPLAEYRMARNKAEAQEIVVSTLLEVGLRPEETLGRYPHQLSGGQRQRIMVARALMLRPRIIVADEPVSMVDASLRATILETLRTLNRKHGISILYITHDLTTAYQLADNIIVLYQGSVAEAGDVENVINNPEHPYTKLLVGSIPQPEPDRPWGAATSALASTGSGPTEGCKFANRCGVAMEMCWHNRPPLYRTQDHRATRCFLYRGSPELGAVDLSSTLVPREVSSAG